jgi:hypothetical protein
MNTQIPEILNPLQHSGTNRFERLGAELDFSYVQIEERHEEDFLRYAKKLAASIQYYDRDNIPAGTWESFFDASIPNTAPHKALFVAFLRLLEALNEHANGLSQRYLDYYYKDVLQFTEREARPTHVHLFFECASALKKRFLDSETLLSAGKNKDGKDILFQLVDELVANRAEVTSFLSVYRHDEEKFGNRLFSNDHSSTLSLDAAENTDGFAPFGEHQLEFTKEDGNFEPNLLPKAERTMDEAELGFSITSPMLRLEEGTRTITARCILANSLQLDSQNDDFQFSISTEDGWYDVEANQESKREIGEYIFTITLKDTDPAMVNYDQEIHSGNYQSAHPILRILIKHSELDPETGKADIFAYSKWKDVIIKDLGLSVDVKGLRSLIVQNDLTTLDPSKPFSPFGSIPTVGNHLYLGHQEVFKHALSSASYHIKWKDIPNSNLANHYAYYSENISNSSFKVNTDILDNKVWYSMNENVNLFDEIDAREPLKINLEFDAIENFQRKTDDREINEWDYKSNYGFTRLTLTTPYSNNFQGFGHAVYAKEVMAHNQEPLENPNQPYTPVIEQVSMDYTTKEIIFSASEIDQFYHVEPFGQKTIELNNSLNPAHIVSQYREEGTLYIGLDKVNPPQSVSLLIQMIEGSGDASQSQIISNVSWSYLSGNDWNSIDRLRISHDSTRNLLNTGVIRFDLSDDIDTNHTIMPDGLFWLKAVIPEKSAGIDRIQNVHAQGIEAIELDANLNDQVIKPDSIAKLNDGSKGISSVNQPYASFGGAPPESEGGFYARVSERLRHKDRGVTIWDYERLVLDAFPELYKVKCLNHTNYKTEVAAGHVMMAVIPNLRNKESKSPFQPKLSMHKRMNIYDHLREIISPFIYLRVENPIYEPIKLSFNVGFHEGYDEGFYGKKLHAQLQEFLSPWAFESETSETTDLVFGGELHKSVVLKFIEDIEYVDFVNDFNMYHVYQDPRIHDDFAAEIDVLNLDSATAVEEENIDRIKIAFQAQDETVLTSLIEIKLRFLKGIIDADLAQLFISDLTTILNSRVNKGEVITKNLLRTLVKSMYYVDKIVELSFYKDLPNGFVLEDVDVAVAKTSRSIMVSDEQHRIGVYKAGDYKCEGNVMIGIGFMIVEADFIIPEIKQENYEYQTR